ncbi:MAG: aspartate ammonia-lyase [Endomicrobiales bacterium]
MKYRKEKDLLGEKEIPVDAYYGIHTLRAKENFSISGYRVNPALIRALAMVKKSCAEANAELGFLDRRKAGAIAAACDEVAEGELEDQFPVDALQGGAGTSTNMNLNEVVANRAIELLGGKKGEYALVHPLEDVNLHQSTNDTYPTALKIAALYKVRELSRKIADLQGALQKKEREFSDVVAIGRTELQEAVPLTLGAEFSAFAEALSRDRWRTFKCEERLRVVNIGGTAVGTGLGAPRSYIFLVIEKLRQGTALGLSRGENTVDQTANADNIVEVSGMLKAHASNLLKTANDLRLLNLLGEIELPRVQAGSSLMPGKVNPVLLESAMSAGMKVMANDGALASAVSRGTLQISEFLPLAAFSLLESLDLLINVNGMLARHAEGIRANAGRCREYFDNSPTLVTAFVPHIGYEKASELIKGFPASKLSVRAFLAKKLGKKLVDRVLSPRKLTALGYAEEK